MSENFPRLLNLISEHVDYIGDQVKRHDLSLFDLEVYLLTLQRMRDGFIDGDKRQELIEEICGGHRGIRAKASLSRLISSGLIEERKDGSLASMGLHPETWNA